MIKAREASFGLAVPVIAATATRPARRPTCRPPRLSLTIFAQEGLRPCRAELLGARRLRAHHGSAGRRGQPLVVAERCVGLIRALSQVKPHRGSPEIYDTDHEIFSHPLDALRYLLVNLPQPAVDDWEPPKPDRFWERQRIW